MWQTLRNAWSIPELRKKISITLGLFLLFRLGTHVAVPGIERAVLYMMQSQGGFIGLMDLFSGGGLLNISLFALGVLPYINSSIIMQLLQVVIPSLEKLIKEGGLEGQRKVATITKWVTLGLATIQSFSFAFFLYPAILNGSNIKVPLLANPESLVLKLFVSFVLLVGSFLLIWLGEVMTEHGIGNGVSLIIFAGVISRILPGILSSIENIRGGSMSWIGFVIGLGIFVAFVGAIIFAYESERRIPVQYAKRIVGRKMYGGQSTYIPVRLIQAGVLPIIFASSLMMFPQIIGRFLPEDNWWNVIFTAPLNDTAGWLYNLIFFLLIVFFTYFYTSITYNPPELADNLQKQGGFIPGVRPGAETAKYFQAVLNKVTLPASFFLGALAIVPNILLRNNPQLNNLFIGGTGILIVIGVALETVSQIESYMTMRSYEGFLRK
jgi:preprotein translocase subunit SecY